MDTSLDVDAQCPDEMGIVGNDARFQHARIAAGVSWCSG
jgi:hypothetical protein